MSLNLSVRFPHTPNSDFFQILRQRVQAYFADNKISKYGNTALYSKAVILYTLYLGGFALILANIMPGWAMLLMCVVIGFAACGLGTNVMHDALHNAYASNKWANKFMGFTMEMLGGSSLTWRIQHNMLHHTYTNVYGMDEDIHDKPFLRLSPDGQLRWYHRFQHIYAILLYGFSNISWILQKDFKQFALYWRNGLIKQVSDRPWSELIFLVAAKATYLFIALALPIWVLDVAWYWVVLGFVIVHFVSGLLMTMIFLTAHAVESAHHYLPDNEGNMENNWAIHQIMTTCNFKTQSAFWHWFVGGLNHQVEHHLFPGISHVHYESLSKIVKQTSHEFGIPYFEYDSFTAAMKSHFNYLKEIGQPQ